MVTPVPGKVTMSGVILAGGAGRRFGRDKAFLKWGKQTFLEFVITKLKPIFPEIIISVKTIARYQHLKDVRLVEDALPIHSSLVGIYSALQAAQYPYAFMVACDMPHVSIGLIRHLIDSTADYDAVVPETSGGLEPLCAIYSRRCLEPIKNQLARNDFKVTNFLSGIKVKTIRLTESDCLRDAEAGFANVNTPEDYEKYCRAKPNK